MVDIRSRSPPREGVRGGLETFNWETIRVGDAKDRDFYLGHSIKLGLAQRGRFYKHDWWSKKREGTDNGEEKECTDSQVGAEVRLVQKYEDELMQEALGIKPKAFLDRKGGAEETEARKRLVRELEEERAKSVIQPESGIPDATKPENLGRKKKKDKKSKRRKLMKKLSHEIKRQEERLRKTLDTSSSSEASGTEEDDLDTGKHNSKSYKRHRSPDRNKERRISFKHSTTDATRKSRGRGRSESRSSQNRRARSHSVTLSPPRKRRK